MSEYLTLLLIPALVGFSWACGRSHGWSGFCIFVGGLGAVVIAVLMTSSGPGQGGGVSMPLVIGVAAVLAAISGAFGVAKRNAFLQSAGVKTPKSG